MSSSNESPKRYSLLNLVSAVLVAALGSGGVVTVYLDYYYRSQPWHLDAASAPGSTAVVVLIQDLPVGTEAEVCYKAGDAPKVLIDNSNSVPTTTPYLELLKGSCLNIRLESGPNIGVFLAAGGSVARGTYRLIR